MNLNWRQQKKQDKLWSQIQTKNIEFSELSLILLRETSFSADQHINSWSSFREKQTLILLNNSNNRQNEESPEEYKSVVEEPKLTNSSSEEPSTSSIICRGGEGGRRAAGILTDGIVGGTRGKRNLWKSKEARWDFSRISSMSADSESESPFFRKNSSTCSMSESCCSMADEREGIWKKERRERN